jgi:hypothetical protein
MHIFIALHQSMELLIAFLVGWCFRAQPFVVQPHQSAAVAAVLSDAMLPLMITILVGPDGLTQGKSDALIACRSEAPHGAPAPTHSAHDGAHPPGTAYAISPSPSDSDPKHPHMLLVLNPGDVEVPQPPRTRRPATGFRGVGAGAAAARAGAAAARADAGPARETSAAESARQSEGQSVTIRESVTIRAAVESVRQAIRGHQRPSEASESVREATMGIELRSLRVVSHPPAELPMPALTEAPCRAITEAPCRAITEATGPAGGPSAMPGAHTGAMPSAGADGGGLRGGLRGGALTASASAVSSPRVVDDDDERAPSTYGPSTYAPISRDVRDDDADT